MCHGDKHLRTESITSQDTYQPGKWDLGETLQLTAKLEPNQQNPKTGILHVATPNGVAAIGSFTRQQAL